MIVSHSVSPLQLALPTKFEEPEQPSIDVRCEHCGGVGVLRLEPGTVRHLCGLDEWIFSRDWIYLVNADGQGSSSRAHVPLRPWGIRVQEDPDA